jgi:dihydroorotate dehydrogenase
VELSRLFIRALHLLPPEAAHEMTLRLLSTLPPPRRLPEDDRILGTTLWGRSFPNPIGLAAGFDKDARAADALLGLGFGLVEVGSVTPRPQPGNPRPRLFRLPEDGAVINRMGFNSEGLRAAAARLTARHGRPGIVGANLGKNRDSADPIADYEMGVATLAPVVDYLVVNISSPNTPGLRDLQRKSEATRLVEHLLAARAKAVPRNPPPLLLKIAPDLTPGDRDDLAALALSGGIDGLVIANTTVARPELQSRHAPEPGGLSGKPLFQPSTQLLAEMYEKTGGKVPLIGVGGISSGRDAYEKIRAGASLVQLYTALIYEGPPLIRRIKRELIALLRRDGFLSVAAAVGSAVKRAEVRQISSK